MEGKLAKRKSMNISIIALLIILILLVNLSKAAGAWLENRLMIQLLKTESRAHMSPFSWSFGHSFNLYC